MAILILFRDRDPEPWLRAIREVDPQIDLRVWPDFGAARDIVFAIAWNHPDGVFQQFPNLRCLQSIGAGVDHILRDPALPEQVAVARIVDPSLARTMTRYLIAAVLSHSSHFPRYWRFQQKKQWQPLPAIAPAQCCIGIMGLGQLGEHAARAFADLGFAVHGWSRTPKSIPNVRTFAGEAQLADFLAETDILICLLPLTPQTQNILNRALFAQLPRGAYVINVARGAHLVDADLLSAFDSGQLSGACLDVFRQEPLPPEHAFWQHPKITITPHISSVTDPQSVAGQIVENYRRLRQNQPLQHTVDRSRGY